MLPIRKVGPARVALTSYYGKSFVERSGKQTNAYPAWLCNRIVAMGLDPEDGRVTEMRTSKVVDPSWQVPRLYTTLAERFRSFNVGPVEFYLEYSHRIEQFGAEAVKAAEQNDLVVIGRRARQLVVVDTHNALYVVGPKGLEDIGRIEDLLELDLERAPLEQADLKVFSKAIPLGVVLGYYLGLETLIAKLALENYRRVPAGERLQLVAGEFAIRFNDESLVFHRDEPLAVLLFSGFDQYHKTIRNYSVYDFNQRDVYLNVLESSGLGVRYLRELDMLRNMFVDPITKSLLEGMGEPTDWVGLMFRAAELLTTDYAPAETDMNHMRIKGYERIAGTVYSELAKCLRLHNARSGGSGNRVEMSPSAIWQAIQEDPAKGQVEESNPIQNLREQEVVTYGGTGGRSRRSMVKSSRIYHKSDMGVISEATVDSGDVAIISYLTADPNFNSLRGTARGYDSAADGPTTLLSTPALLAPGATRDD